MSKQITSIDRQIMSRFIDTMWAIGVIHDEHEILDEGMFDLVTNMFKEFHE